MLIFSKSINCIIEYIDFSKTITCIIKYTDLFFIIQIDCGAFESYTHTIILLITYDLLIWQFYFIIPLLLIIFLCY